MTAQLSFPDAPLYAEPACASLSPQDAAELIRQNLRLLEQLTTSMRVAEPKPARDRIRSPEHVAAFLRPLFDNPEQEQLRVILLNNKNDIIGQVMIYQGSVNSCSIRISEIFREAVRQNAVSIIVSHNHPSGDADPSPEDVKATRAIVAAGKTLDIDVLDHIVVGSGTSDYRSIRQYFPNAFLA